MDINTPFVFDTLYDDDGHEYYSADNALIQWTNFAGRATDYNREGKRNFIWRIPDPELAQKLANLGLNIKHRSVRDGFDGDEYDYLRMDISYETDKGIPIEDINPKWLPKIYLVDDNNVATLIDKESLGVFDGKTITYVYFEFRCRPWTYNNKKTGVAANVMRMLIKVKKDRLDGRFKFVDSAIRPNDYSVQRTQEIRANREAEQQAPGGDDLPFNI